MSPVSLLPCGSALQLIRHQASPCRCRVKIRPDVAMALSGPSPRTRSPAQNQARPPGPKISNGGNEWAAGKSPPKGILIDFIGNFSNSARWGLPIYRVSGGPGFIWAASFDPEGRGTLRFFAIDPGGFVAGHGQREYCTDARFRESAKRL
jgi:hypothetical protein